jgi:hypothetical protein
MSFPALSTAFSALSLVASEHAATENAAIVIAVTIASALGRGAMH